MEKSGAPPYEANPAPQYSQTTQPIMQQDSFQNNQALQTQQQVPKQEHYSGTPQPQGALMQQQQSTGQMQTQQYTNVVPLQSLQERPATVDCPRCHAKAMTTVDAVTGNTTNAWAAVTCICCCLGCIPYMMRYLKDIEHRCGQCGIVLATWHNSGRTVVEASA